MLQLCKQHRIKNKQIAKIITAGNMFTYQLKQNGFAKKYIRREMYLQMAKVMEQTKQSAKNQMGNLVMQRIKAQIRHKLQNRIKDNQQNISGTQNQNRYKNKYHGERGYQGAHGKQKPGR